MAQAKYTNTPPENQVSRRAVLAAPIAAGAAAIAPPSVAATSSIRSAFFEWRALTNRINARFSDSNADTDAMCARLRKMELAIYAAKTTCLEDIILKLAVLTEDGRDFMDDCNNTGLMLMAEAKAMVAA